MTTKEAVLRIIQETTLFSDRPDYSFPEKVVVARRTLGHVFGLTNKELWSYPPDESS